MLKYLAEVMAIVAKHGGRGKRQYNLRRVRVTPVIALSTLASGVVIVGVVAPNATQAYRAMSVKLLWALRDHTAGEGPLLFGYAHSDYAVTEIKECIEAQASIDTGDKVLMEQANRLVRLVGQFSGQATEEVVNDGRPLKTRLNWAINIGDNVNAFVYNESGAALTTGTVMNASGDMWVKDA